MISWKMREGYFITVKPLSAERGFYYAGRDNKNRSV